MGGRSGFPPAGETDADGGFPQPVFTPNEELDDIYPTRGIITLGEFRDSLIDFGIKSINDWDKFSFVLRSVFMDWLKQPLYLVFENEEEETLIFRQGSKRGNRIYVGRGYKRIDPVKKELEQLDESYFVNKRDRRVKTKSLFITLTVDPSLFLGNRELYWKRISYYFDKFKRAIIKKYGKAFVLRGVIESTLDGFPHIHVVIIFKDREFSGFVHRNKFRIEKTR